MKYSMLIFMILGFFSFSCTSDDIEFDVPITLKSSQDLPLEEKESSTDPTQPTTTISLDKMEYDFGSMSVGDKKETYFKITNTGDEPLIISSAKGSCGCTVPEWPKKPIDPGSSEEILVVFTAKTTGKQTKTVTIQANTDPNPTRLKITADVIENSASN